MYLLLVIAALASIILALFSLSQAWVAWRYGKSKQQKNPLSATGSSKANALPTVLIQLPVYNEPLVIERLLRKVAAIDYPRSALTIQLLDDSTDNTFAIAERTIHSIATAGGPKIEHIRRDGRAGYKAGALAYGLTLNQSEFVAIFDADFLPEPSFLKKVIPHFSNARVGLVQARWKHINRDQSLLTKLLAFAIDNHFSVEQGGRQAAGCFINFNGTAGVWRRKTIDDAGGWSSDCLTEDLDLSFRAQLNAWKFHFAEDVTIPAELPVTLEAARQQQFRWSKGMAETARKALPRLWASHESLGRKYVGTIHLLSSCTYVMVFMVGVFCSLTALVSYTPPAMLSIAIHVLLAVTTLGYIFTYAMGRRYGGFDWLNNMGLKTHATTILFLLLVMGSSISNGWAVVQGLFGRETPFVRTPKFNAKSSLQALHKGTFNGSQPVGQLFLLECAALAYFTLAMLVGLATRNWAFVDTSAMFAAAFSLPFYFTMRDLRASRIALSEFAKEDQADATIGAPSN